MVIQPTSLCNLNCSYCYVPERKNSLLMSDLVLDATIKKLLSSSITAQNIEFLWHAGEPLSAGRLFYEKALALINQHNIQNRNVTNVIQTNGTLINDEWCKFFIKYDFRVGISIDGPAFIHNTYRKNWAGVNTHDQVMRGVNLLREYGIKYNALCVLTDKSLDYPLEIFDFFYKNGFQSVGFNIEETESPNVLSSFYKKRNKEWDKIKERYSKFISTLYDVWTSHLTEITIREFNDVLRMINLKIKNPTYFMESNEIRKLGMLIIQKNGDITTNSPEFAGNYSTRYGNFVVGNIVESTDLHNIIQNNSYIQLQNDIDNGIKNCAETCRFFHFCGGAFLPSKLFENGSLESTETTACILHKQILTSVLVLKLAGVPLAEETRYISEYFRYDPNIRDHEHKE